jgi:hypothetical protein
MRPEVCDGSPGEAGIAARNGRNDTADREDGMIRKAFVAVALVGFAAWPAAAQDRVEIGAFFGYTFSDGVTFPATVVPGTGQSADRIEPKDALSWGVNFDVFLNDSAEVGALISQQQSSLIVSGPGFSRDIGNSNVNNYHAVFTYNFGDPVGVARAYIFGGVGATHYGSVDTGSGSISGVTRFSSTWGAGVKIYPGEHVGAKVTIRWTPTYIKTDPGGYWCDPFWGCYVVGNAQYSNQFEFSGGITARF